MCVFSPVFLRGLLLNTALRMEADGHAEHVQPHEQDRFHGGLRSNETACEPLLSHRYLWPDPGERSNALLSAGSW